MAERAHQEPTMEEILSSIRKIIADDTSDAVAAPKEAGASDFDVTEADDDAFDDLELTIEDSPELAELTEKLTSDVFDTASRPDPVAAPEEDTFEDAVAEPDFFAADEPEPITADEDVFEDFTAPPPELVEEPGDAFEPMSEVEEAALEPLEAAPTIEEPPMSAQPFESVNPSQVQETVLADSRTVDAAAGSLGKLLSKVEFGEEGGATNTIEGVVKDLLRPMLKEWLDDNLPGIVDEHVEREVQRIARMAR